ncbi:MAG TPA: nitroreductase/quinone reductase family protein [Acidimicrobiia bacterium]
MTPEQSAAEYGYLTTRGRVTGRDHTIEIWFAHDGKAAYVLAGDGDNSDWCRNIEADPAVTFVVEDQVVGRRARRVVDPAEDAIARRVVCDKYQPGYGEDLSEWRDEATPFAVDLD